MLNVPNALTLGRMALVPVFVLVFYLPFQWCYAASAVIFAIAGATDWLDGYLARKLNQSTPFGAFLDPVADKVMVAIALVMLTERYQTWWVTLPAVVIIAREIIISALREWMAEIGRRTSVAVSYIGKIKTTVQMLAIIGLLLISRESHVILIALCELMLVTAASLTLWSAFIYMRAAWPEMRK